MDAIRKLILSEYPNYDFDRYRFDSGDYIETQDGALIIVDYSALEYIQGYVIKRSLIHRTLGSNKIEYKNLPYYKKGEFHNKIPKITRKVKWNLYDIVELTDSEMIVLLYEEVRPQGFYGFVLQSENGYYLHNHIYLVNPYEQYIAE